MENPTKEVPPDCLGLIGDEASSMYSLLRKTHSWMTDIFGVLPNGQALVRRVIKVSPLTNSCFLTSDGYNGESLIQIWVDGVLVRDKESLTRLLKGLQVEKYSNISKIIPSFGFTNTQTTPFMCMDGLLGAANQTKEILNQLDDTWKILQKDTFESFVQASPYLDSQEINPKLCLAKARYLARGYYYGWISDSQAIYRAHTLAAMALEDGNLTSAALGMLTDTSWDMGNPIQAVQYFKSYNDYKHHLY